MTSQPIEPADLSSPSGPELVPDPAKPNLAEMIGRLQRAHRRRLRDEMRRCFHDDARIESIAAGKVLGPDDTVDAILAAFEDGIYSMSDWTIEPLDDPDVVLAWGGVRHRAADDPSRISDSTIYWLTSGRDGLMWRVRVFSDRAAATKALADHGRTLGLDPAD